MIHQISESNKEYLLGVLHVILKTNDLEIIKYTIESLIEEIEDADISDNIHDNMV